VTDAPNLYQKARSDVAGMLGYDLVNLTPEQSMRVDVASALRVLLDTQSGRLVRGESLDARELLMASEALSRLLPPAVLATPPAEQHDDNEAAIAPLRKLFRFLHGRVAELEVENAQLRSRLGLPARGAGTPISPPLSDIVPPAEWRGETYAGVRPGPDDPRPVTIDGTVKRPEPPSAPERPAWQDWLDRGGSVGGDPWANNNR
jgi:hypothetical protein